MSLPTYNKDKRKKSFQVLPKGAYVVKIVGVKQTPNKSGNGEHLAIAFDIAEGEYTDFYQKQFDSNPNEDRKWNNDGIYRLNIPNDGSASWVWDNWNTFFADLEDSNQGFVFDGENLTALKGKLIGGKFNIRQTTYNGNIYDHTQLKWTCIASDVRNNTYGKLPNDQLEKSAPKPAADSSGFMTLPDDDEEIPF